MKQSMIIAKEATNPKGVNDVDGLIAQRIRLARKEKGLTLKDLADSLGISSQQMQKYENASNRLTCQRMVQISKLLGFDAAKLLDGLANSTENTSATPELDTECYSLLKHFKKISSPRVRKNILEMVRTMSDLE